MMGGNGGWPRSLGLLALLGLGALNWRLLTMPIDISPASLPPGEETALPPQTAPDAPPPAAPESAASFPQTLARPLFSPDRRPREKKPDATAALRQPKARTQAPPPSIELVGIIKDGRGSGRALIRSDGEASGVWVQVGHELQGWRLSRIEARSILLEADGRQVQLSLNPLRE